MIRYSDFVLAHFHIEEADAKPLASGFGVCDIGHVFNTKLPTSPQVGLLTVHAVKEDGILSSVSATSAGEE